MLWVYDKEENVPHKRSPKNTAAINDLYKVSVPGLSRNALEIAFSNQESLVSPILSKWREPGAIPEIPEIREVAYFVALLYLRNPKTDYYSAYPHSTCPCFGKGITVSNGTHPSCR
jgi:hypothetical protein